VVGVLAVLAVAGVVAGVFVRYQMQRRWQNAPGAGAITGEHLYTALSNGEMTLHYQPILDAAGDRLAGVEALVRWEHPEFGTVSPRRFLAKAESTGVMRYLGEFVLRSSCDFIHELHQSRLPGVRLTVNASASQLEDPEFPEIVARALRDSGLEAESLEIEVNERASLARPAVIEGLAKVRALGVAIGLDDYWSEALTVDQLKALGVSSVKVDLWSNTGSPGARLRIHEAVERARGLGLTVTAKRVETLHEVEFLRELHCDYAQGHAFNEPMPEDVFLARMGLFEDEERLAS
jgi:EAL domain-containing protein (putative c-di-GMP-specific phosphodiesterase class I)